MRTRKNYLTKVAIAFSLAFLITFLLVKPSNASPSIIDSYRFEALTVSADKMVGDDLKSDQAGVEDRIVFTK